MKYLILILFIFSNLFAQTTQWHLTWNSNIEEDMSHYGIVKQIEDGAFVWTDSSNHRFGQDRQGWIDNDIIPGILYSYYLVAYNTALLVSEPSDTVSAAIPNVYDIPDQIITGGDPFAMINLDDYVYDPDGDELVWTVEGNVNITIGIVGNLAVIGYEEGFRGSETVTFIATQTDTLTAFWDSDVVTFTVEDIPAPDRVTDIRIEWVD